MAGIHDTKKLPSRGLLLNSCYFQRRLYRVYLIRLCHERF